MVTSDDGESPDIVIISDDEWLDYLLVNIFFLLLNMYVT